MLHSISIAHSLFLPLKFQAAKQYFHELGAKRKSYLMIEFVADSVSLNIPMPGGVDVKEWNLTPLVPPMVLSYSQCSILEAVSALHRSYPKLFMLIPCHLNGNSIILHLCMQLIYSLCGFALQ